MEVKSIEEELEALARQYARPDPTFSFMPRGNEASDRQLRLDDLSSKPSVRSSSPMKVDGSRGESKAVAAAMKALQDKIKRLESVNEKLRSDLQSSEMRLDKDRERWQEQSQRDRADSQEKESLILSRIKELEEDLRKQRLKEVNIEEYVKSLTRQLQGLQSQADQERNTALERERTLQERVEMMNRQAEMKGKEVELLERNLEKAERERSRLADENADLALELDKLSAELDYLKQSGENSATAFLTRMHENESSVARKVDEYAGKIKDLELQNQHLSELTAAKEQQVETLRQEVDSLKRANASSESARFALSQESEKARKLAYEATLANERLAQSMRDSESQLKAPRKAKVRTTSATRTRSKSPKITTRKPPAPYSPHESSVDDDSRIVQLEREIKRHNEDYKEILQQSESMELSRLRDELNSIAEVMEDKSRELTVLRRRQQSQIRSQVQETI